jgi:hypothetical protein
MMTFAGLLISFGTATKRSRSQSEVQTSKTRMETSVEAGNEASRLSTKIPNDSITGTTLVVAIESNSISTNEDVHLVVWSEAKKEERLLILL